MAQRVVCEPLSHLLPLAPNDTPELVHDPPPSPWKAISIIIFRTEGGGNKTSPDDQRVDLVSLSARVGIPSHSFAEWMLV